MVDSKTLHICSQEWLRRADLYSYVENRSFNDEDVDFILTYFQYLKTKSLMRPEHSPDSGSVFVYSKVGRERISDDDERTQLINEFMRFYTGSVD